MEKFYLDQYIKAIGSEQGRKPHDFSALCRRVLNAFLAEWETSGEDMDAALRIQKHAIIGYEKEVAYFKDKVRQLLHEYGAEDADCPPWYESLVDGIYHENWGLAGMAAWFVGENRHSSSAKIIGERIYFLENGRMVLQTQQVTRERREQLVRAFLLLTPEERLDKDFHEIYLLDGTRITIFCGGLAKEGQDAIIFRRYVVPTYRFEEQASRRTIPWKAIPLFEAMVELGYNTVFTGAVRSGKTSFLTTWQSYEDRSLEGVMVETDPEIPLHRLMKEAPIIQLLADNDNLKHIAKNLLRSDADYFILAEARDGIALDTAVRIASKGTRRMKLTFHTREPLDFCYDVASEIVKAVGGSIPDIEKKVACSFDYLFHFIQLQDKSQKRLRGIYELSYDREKGEISVIRICSYDAVRDDWVWNWHIGRDKQEVGEEENREAYRRFSSLLCGLAEGGG